MDYWLVELLRADRMDYRNHNFLNRPGTHPSILIQAYPPSATVTPGERVAKASGGGAGAAPTGGNFPRNTRNRQTFHGKTEHNKVSGCFTP